MMLWSVNNCAVHLHLVLLSTVVHTELLSEHSLAVPVVLQGPPGPTSVSKEWNYDQEYAHIKTLIFNKNLYSYIKVM
jgi:hypothetical protein